MIEKILDSIRATATDWGTILSESNFQKRPDRISWPNSDGVPWTPDVVDYKFVRSLISGRHFSFLVREDSSIVQLRYQFDARGRELRSATLSYFGNRSALEETALDDLLYARFLDQMGSDELPEDGVEAPSDTERDAFTSEIMGTADAPAPWMRIDYDPKSASSHIHAATHIHVGGLTNARLPLTRVPSPRQFIEFIIGTFYPETYRSHRLNEPNLDRILEKLRDVNDLAPFCSSMVNALEHYPRLYFPESRSS